MRELIWVMRTEANQQERLLRRQLDHEVAILPEIFHATIGLRSALSVLNMRRFASLLQQGRTRYYENAWQCGVRLKNVTQTTFLKDKGDKYPDDGWPC
jgi:hypothetical protein